MTFIINAKFIVVTETEDDAINIVANHCSNSRAKAITGLTIEAYEAAKASEQPVPKDPVHQRIMEGHAEMIRKINDQPVECRSVFEAWMKEERPSNFLDRNKTGGDGYEYTPTCYLWRGWEQAWHHKRESLSQWHPIETYKGGEAIFYQPKCEGRMGPNERVLIDNCKPHRETTHWMPAPKPPTTDIEVQTTVPGVEK